MHPERAREWTPQRVMAYGLPTLGCDADEAVALREDQRGGEWKGGPAHVRPCGQRCPRPLPGSLEDSDAPEQPPPLASARAAWLAGSFGRGASGPPRLRGGLEAEAAARRSRASGPQVGDSRAAVGRGSAAAHPGLRVAEQPTRDRAARRVRRAPPRGRPAARPPLHPIPSRPEDCVVAYFVSKKSSK